MMFGLVMEKNSAERVEHVRGHRGSVRVPREPVRRKPRGRDPLRAVRRKRPDPPLGVEAASPTWRRSPQCHPLRPPRPLSCQVHFLLRHL